TQFCRKLAAERPLKDIRDEYNYPKKKGIKDECSRLLEASTMKSRRGFAIQRLMNEIGRAVQQECRDRTRMPSSACKKKIQLLNSNTGINATLQLFITILSWCFMQYFPITRFILFVFFLMLRHTPKSTLFPYTTLFRSSIITPKRKVLRMSVQDCWRPPL